MASAPPRGDARMASRLTRGKARSFYLASLFMPSAVRADVHALYAFYRTVDDLVDEPAGARSRQDRVDTLLGWEDALRGGLPTDNAFVGGAIDLADRHHIPISDLCLVLEGARFDVDMRTIETTPELIHYSVLMAGSVGLVMSRILGGRDAESLSAASDLGVAMQITNILRDVGEDLTRGRIYLPHDELQKHGCTINDLKRGEVTEPFRGVMQSLTLLAREYYDSGMRGIPRLDRSSQFSIYLAATLYSRILDKIEEQGFNVFGRRACLGAAEKWMITMPTYLAHRQVDRRQS